MPAPMTPRGAEERLIWLLAGGLALGVLAGILIAAGWPEPPTVDAFGYEQEGGGSMVAVIAGLGIGAASQIMMGIAIVGYGVRFGRLASPL